MASHQPLLSVRELSIAFGRGAPYLHAVRQASLTIMPGETVGLIGQSGSGKTTLAMGLLGLIRGAPGVWAGQAFLDGCPLLPEMDPYVSKNELGEIKKQYVPFLRSQKKQLRDLLGRDIAVIFQEPKASLDPFFTVGEHLNEALARSQAKATTSPRERSIHLLQDVGLVDAENLLGLYPHEISGGMAQRVMISMALAAKPKLLIADEPSTSLDVTTQAKLLQLFRRLKEKHGLSLLLISHDIGVIQEVCDRLYVMHRGAVVEAGEAKVVLTKPGHPYTSSLLESFSHFGEHQAAPPVDPEKGQGCAYCGICSFYREPDSKITAAQRLRCETDKPALQSGGQTQDHEFARCHFPEASKRLLDNRASDLLTDANPRHPIQKGNGISTNQDPEKTGNAYVTHPLLEIKSLQKTFLQGKRTFRALDDVSLTISTGQTYGLVGESGSGKSTLALSVMALQPIEKGEVVYLGRNIVGLNAKAIRELRREYRMLFQHPEGVLNSGMTLFDILAEGLKREPGLSRKEIEKRVAAAMEEVRLDPAHALRYPGNLSSGEKQRVTIARAMITRPKFLVCDEPVASLDLAIQSQILALLKDLQRQLELTYLFISHNLLMVRLLADTIGVMYMGQLVEEAPATRFEVSLVRHPYTRLLLASVPAVGRGDLNQVLEEYPDVEPVRLVSGCPFRNRCPLYAKVPLKECERDQPVLKWVGAGARVACHQVTH